MSIRASSLANKGKNPRRESPEVIDLRNESCISTASRIQSQPATLLPLDVETQARRTEVPESLKELVGVPYDRNPKTRQFEFPEERDLNSEERGPPLGPASDDDEPASYASSDLMNLLPTPINEHPGYIVQYTLRMLGIGKGRSGTHLVRAGDIFPLTGVSKKVHQEAFQQARSLGHRSCILLDVEAELLYAG
jgi:hypothetical protein